jgi:hypothetical protein
VFVSFGSDLASGFGALRPAHLAHAAGLRGGDASFEVGKRRRHLGIIQPSRTDSD